jgi:putative iron-only hydrogenase system regulator
MSFGFNKSSGDSMKRIGVVGIVVKGDRSVVTEMQRVLSDFADIIAGRMGVPRNGVNTIALIVEGTGERISALTGRLGQIKTLSVKSALTTFELVE